MRTRNKPLAVAWWLCPLALAAQTPPDIGGILARLDRLEQENRDLVRQVQELRTELSAARTTPAPPAAAPAPAVTPPDIDERLATAESRIEEQAQSKVESAQKFPIRLAGMALFNTFLDSSGNNATDYPTVAAPAPERAGGTLRQSIIGLEFHGPRAIWGGEVHGSVYMDFFTGSTTFTQSMKLRTGSIEIDWKNRSLLAGVEKPIFNPREPASLAQVGVSPLTGAGNLWLWVPQVRLEQDLKFSSDTGLRARVGVIETHEVPPYDNMPINGRLAPARPGLEGRFEFFHNIDDDRHLELAAGFHTSTTHAGGFSIQSNLWALDWSYIPWRRLEFTGAFYSGQNVANLGTGAINQGYALYRHSAEAVESRGGWGQITLHAASRLDFHFFTGQQDDANHQLDPGDIGKNLAFGANLYFHLAPNVILAPEAAQLRTVYLARGVVINNHYDLALAYLF